MWSYQRVESGFGILKGPMEFELNIETNAFDLQKTAGGRLEEVIINCDEDHAASVSLKKGYTSTGLPIIIVSTLHDIGMKFWLDYTDSFEAAIVEMMNHFEEEEEEEV